MEYAEFGNNLQIKIIPFFKRNTCSVFENIVKIQIQGIYNHP